MEPVPRTLPENFRVVYEWLRRLDRRTQRVSRPPALMPGARLGPNVGQIEDLNEAVLTGWYQSSGTSDANRPPTTGSLEVQVVALASGSVFQTARTHGAAGLPYGEEWVRDLRGAQGWSDWRPTRIGSTSFTPEWLNGEFNGSLDYATYSVADGVATVEVSQVFGAAGQYGDIQMTNPLAAYTTPPGSTKAIQCAGRLTSSGTTSIGTPGGLLSSNAQILYARLLTVSGDQLIMQPFSSSRPGGMTSSGRITVVWSFPIS